MKDQILIRIFVQSIVLCLLFTAVGSCERFQVTVEGSLVETTPNVDPYNLHQADFRLVFVYDTDAEIESTTSNPGCSISISGFDFEKAHYTFLNRPNNAPNATAEIFGNLTVQNAPDCSFSEDRFRFPQGNFDLATSTEFDGLVAGNGAGLSFGNTTFFPGVEPPLQLPVLEPEVIDSVHWTNYVFFSRREGILYNYSAANVTEIIALDVVLGDVNCDSAVDFQDVAPFINAIRFDTYSANADANEDGLVNLFDIFPFIELLSSATNEG